MDGDNVYEVVVTASDGMARSSKTVSVTVTNEPETRDGDPDAAQAAGRHGDNGPAE